VLYSADADYPLRIYIDQFVGSLSWCFCSFGNLPAFIHSVTLMCFGFVQLYANSIDLQTHLADSYHLWDLVLVIGGWGSSSFGCQLSSYFGWGLETLNYSLYLIDCSRFRNDRSDLLKWGQWRIADYSVPRPSWYHSCSMSTFAYICLCSSKRLLGLLMTRPNSSATGSKFTLTQWCCLPLVHEAA
jgi:hypothetical protein